MHTMRRIIASYGRCRRYAPLFKLEVLHFLDEVHPRIPRSHYGWIATAKLRNGRLFVRALNVDSDGQDRWRVRDEKFGRPGSREPVDDVYAAFADWLERVEDELGHVAMRGLAADLASPFFHYSPKDKH